MATLTASTTPSTPIPAPRSIRRNRYDRVDIRRDARRGDTLYDVLLSGATTTVANPVCLGLLIFICCFLIAEFTVTGADKLVGLLEYLAKLVETERAVKERQRVEIVILNLIDKILLLVAGYKTKIVVLAGYLVTVVELPTNTNLLSAACFAAASIAFTSFATDLQLLAAASFWAFAHTRRPNTALRLFCWRVVSSSARQR